MTATTDTTTGIPDLYPSRGAVEALTPRQDPVVWGAPDAPGPVAPADLLSFETEVLRTVDEPSRRHLADSLRELLLPFETH